MGYIYTGSILEYIHRLRYRIYTQVQLQNTPVPLQNIYTGSIIEYIHKIHYRICTQAQLWDIYTHSIPF